MGIQSGGNVQKSGLEKISKWMCVRAGVETSKNSNICISGITQSIELKFSTEVKPKWPFLQYNFCRNWLAYWDFMRFWIFWKMSVNTLAATNFKRSC